MELASVAGLNLDPWQQIVLEHALGERRDGKWSAFEVGLVVSRQNGKGGILEARELAGLFLLGERLITHSAHQFDTSLEAFRRLLTLIEDTPDFDRRVKRVSRAHGEEGIELKGGQRIRFRTRTKGGGRGFTGDCLILDEAMILPESAHGALLPTLSARPNPQVWYTGSAVDQVVHEHGTVLARLRERGIRGDEGLAYFEWSVDVPHPEEVSDEFARDPAAWAISNPALGIRISDEYVEREQRAMDPRTFAVERLGAGDWPDLSAGGDARVLNLEAWKSRTDVRSAIAGELCFVYDVRPDRSRAAIGAAGVRSDGRRHLEVIDHRAGTGWVAERLNELRGRHSPVAIACDGKSPAASLIAQCEEYGIPVETLSTPDHAEACGQLVDAIDQDTVRHLGTAELESAVKGAVKRPFGDSWTWSRKASAVDISPLVAVTLAHWRINQPATSKPLNVKDYRIVRL